MTWLSESVLLDAAVKATAGLTDFGEPSFLTPLRILTHSLTQEAELPEGARAGVSGGLIQNLANRLRIQRDLTARPAIKSIGIHRPLFIVGFPRTGTTLLHNLLAMDPQNRMPLFYEVLSPASPAPREDGRDSRILATQALFERLPQTGFNRIHAFEPLGPEECHWLFRNSFTAWTYWSSWNVPSYQEWLAKQDLAWQYGEYKSQLQLLLEQRPGHRLVLKYPFHMAYLPVLFETFPEACVVQCHRSPSAIVGSYASFMYETRCMTYGSADRSSVLDATLKRLVFALERNLADRCSSGLSSASIYDLRYDELVEDPAKVVREIYEYFDYSFESEMEIRIQRWLDENPQHKHGKHDYSLEQFGADQDRIERIWGGYRERFRV